AVAANLANQVTENMAASRPMAVGLCGLGEPNLVFPSRFTELAKVLERLTVGTGRRPCQDHPVILAARSTSRRTRSMAAPWTYTLAALELDISNDSSKS